MNQASGTIERAYQLARAGGCRTVEEIARRLTAEGFDSPQAHLAGKGLRTELRSLMKAQAEMPPVPGPGHAAPAGSI